MWRSINQEILVQGDNFRGDNQSWNQLLAFLQEKELVEQGMYTCWMIWNNRNNCLHNMSCSYPPSLALMAAKMKDYSVALFLPSMENQIS